MAKDVVYTAFKPTGKPTLGNYVGAAKSLKSFIDKYDTYICVADLHALTINPDPKTLKENTYDMFALYLALGLDYNKCTLYVQSQVPAHTSLSWILNNYTMHGEASRMTQYKDYVAKGKQVNVGLFDYPVLMAADILLYDTKYVPVGIDQVQHVELARNIAVRFNNKMGETFVLPEAVVNKTGSKIMGLNDPTKKMSKSEAGDTGTIFLEDDEDTIRKKIKRAVTDSDGIIAFDTTNKPGVSNLLTIYATLAGKSIDETLAHFKGANYGTLKQEVADVVVQTIKSFQQKYFELRSNTKELDRIMAIGAKKATEVANKKLKQVYDVVGLV